MLTVAQQIAAADSAISNNIDTLGGQRDLLSQNVLSQLRNLVEGVAVHVHTGSGDTPFEYPTIVAALGFVRSNGRLNFLTKFHDLLQPSTSHYTFDGDTSERLMLKYYEYLHRIRTLLQDRCGIAALASLDAFPIDIDPALLEYQEKIAVAIDRSGGGAPVKAQRYYIHKTRPFFAGGRIYYEVTFYKAVNRVSKADRIIGFTEIDITDSYSANLTLQAATIEVFGHQMPVTLIRTWDVSIRPCELNRFASLVGLGTRARTDSSEYRFVMGGLTSGWSLLDLIDAPDERYVDLRARGTAGVGNAQIFPALDEARRVIRARAPGHNVLRYLLLRMRNEVLKAQEYWEPCSRLSDLNLKFGCIPFDRMPFCTALVRHNPRFWDLVHCLDPTGRTHEFLARRVQRNVDDRGILYTAIAELEDLGDLGDITELVATHNQSLYRGHRDTRSLRIDKGHIFIQQYEDHTHKIVMTLQEHAAAGVAGYTTAVDHWLAATTHVVDDNAKRAALRTLFAQSRVALIYGAAGTGKSTMVDHVANYFHDKHKLFLANTHPAVENLKRRVSSQGSSFRTIASHLSRGGAVDYDLLVIDECSTVSNADLLKVLEATSFKLLVLVGDVFQIESIRFGNWFNVIRSFIPGASIFELETPYRTSDAALVEFWDKVRRVDGDITETIARNGYSTVLDATLFATRDADEIILALNYDGLYGINNINRFLQASNPYPPITWGPATYKVDDPVLFTETDRFRPLIYNNLKGRITAIERHDERIQFDIELARPVTELDVEDFDDLEWVGESTVRFSVYDFDVSDDDDDTVTTVVPFHVAYAVSIHKAQGLEYATVKVVITSANQEDITHSIFYTAVTRAREHLRIYWSPETQNAVIGGLHTTDTKKDVALLATRRGLTPASRR
jgi:hypothetical protein